MEKLIDYILSDDFERKFTNIIGLFVLVVGSFYLVRVAIFFLDFIATH